MLVQALEASSAATAFNRLASMTGFGNYSPREEMPKQTHPFKTIIAELAHLAMQIEEINRKPFGPGIDLDAPASDDGESGDGEDVRLVASPAQVLAS